jgi:hypothetical protein
MEYFFQELDRYIERQKGWIPAESKKGFKNMIEAYREIATEIEGDPDWDCIVAICNHLRNQNGSFWGHLSEMREAGGVAAQEVESLYRSLHENLEVIRVMKEMPLDIVADQLTLPERYIPEVNSSHSAPGF